MCLVIGISRELKEGEYDKEKVKRRWDYCCCLLLMSYVCVFTCFLVHERVRDDFTSIGDGFILIVWYS